MSIDRSSWGSYAIRITTIGVVLHSKWSGGEPKVAAAVVERLARKGYATDLFVIHPFFVSLRVIIGTILGDVDPLAYIIYLLRFSLRRPKVALVFYDVNNTAIRVCHTLGIPTVVAVHIHWPYCPKLSFWNNVHKVSCSLVASKDCYQCLKRSNVRFLPPTRILTNLWVTTKKNIIQQSSAIVVSSEFMKATVVRELKVSPQKVNVIRTGIDVNIFSPSTTLPRSDGKRIVLYVGGLTIEKGLEQFLYLARTICQRRTDVQFIVIGRGPLATHVKDLPYITFLGAVSLSELIKMYRKASVVVAPYLWDDPSPQVPLESMACGTPVICYRAGGVPECVLHGKTGFLADQGDIQALTEYVEKILNDDRLLRNMRKISREWVVQNFTMTNMADQYVHMLESFVT